MAEDSQIRELLKAWLDYIHVENLSNAKVEADVCLSIGFEKR